MSSQSPRNLLCQALVDPLGPADSYYMNYIIVLYIMYNSCLHTNIWSWGNREHQRHRIEGERTNLDETLVEGEIVPNRVLRGRKVEIKAYVNHLIQELFNHR